MLRFNGLASILFMFVDNMFLKPSMPSLPFSHIEEEALGFKNTVVDNPPILCADHVPWSLLLIRYFLMFMNVKDYCICNPLTGAAKANLKNWTSPIPSPTTKIAWLVTRRWVSERRRVYFVCSCSGCIGPQNMDPHCGRQVQIPLGTNSQLVWFSPEVVLCKQELLWT